MRAAILYLLVSFFFLPPLMAQQRILRNDSIRIVEKQNIHMNDSIRVVETKNVHKNDSIRFVEKTLKKVNKNINFTIVPGPVYGTTQKLGFAVLPMLVYNLDKKDTLSPPSSSSLMLYCDLYGSWLTYFRQSFYWNQNKWRAFISFGTGDLKLKFFGMGRGREIISNHDTNYSWTHQQGYSVSITCFRKIYMGLYGGLEYIYRSTTLLGSDSTGDAALKKAALQTGQISESVFVPTLVWDNRDNIFWTTRGCYASINFQYASKELLSSGNYDIIEGSVNGYHSLLKNRGLILAWHLFAQKGWGELPYNRYANYAQGDDVTGYTRGKYVDHAEATLQMELRIELWRYFACGVYGGTGKVFPNFETFGPYRWLHYGGLRVYVNIIPSPKHQTPS
jgi:hypothetical protein